ncbi:MAG TPA: HEAT repeat domain-containing protein [Gaiellaceae bacterium]|nr:HEAT repeat domain-containing protein [Gaiellaceae bacterium]
MWPAGRRTSSSRSAPAACSGPRRSTSARLPARSPLSDLASAAAEAAELAERGDERELAAHRTKWQDEIEGAARSPDFRERALAYRAIGQFRYRQKLELLRRGLQDESPASRGSALLSLELLSRDHPGDINADRSLLHSLAAADPNATVRRLAILVLKNGSPHRDTIVMLEGMADDDELDRELREAAKRVAAQLTKKSRAR